MLWRLIDRLQRDKGATHLCRFAIVAIAKVLCRNKLIDHNLLDSSFTLLKRVKPSRKNKQAASGSKGRRKRSTDVGETDDDAPPNVDDYLPGLATDHFFCFLFCTKSFCCHAWRQINDPLSGIYFSLPLLPAIPSSPSRTLDSPRALPPELQRNKDTVRCAALGAENS